MDTRAKSRPFCLPELGASFGGTLPLNLLLATPQPLLDRARVLHSDRFAHEALDRLLGNLAALPVDGPGHLRSDGVPDPLLHVTRGDALPRLLDCLVETSLLDRLAARTAHHLGDQSLNPVPVVSVAQLLVQPALDQRYVDVDGDDSCLAHSSPPYRPRAGIVRPKRSQQGRC